MIPVWPDDLPQRVLAGQFQVSARGNRLATPPDAGPPKQRRRGPLVRPVACAIAVDADGRARFDRFFEEELNVGVTPFLLPDQLMDGRLLMTEDGKPLLADDGVPIIIESWWLVQFGQTQPPMPAATPRVFHIQFDLLVLP